MTRDTLIEWANDILATARRDPEYQRLAKDDTDEGIEATAEYFQASLDRQVENLPCCDDDKDAVSAIIVERLMKSCGVI